MEQQLRITELQRDDITQAPRQLAGADEVDPEKDLPTLDFSASRIEHIQMAQGFIRAVQSATLDRDKLDEDALYRLRHPPQSLAKLEDPDTVYSIDLYMACSRHPESAYNDTRAATLKRYPEMTILSLYQVRNLVASLTGVTTSEDDMCDDGCHAFTGPLADLRQCGVCSKPRWHPREDEDDPDEVRRPVQKMVTIPLGPQLQALRRSPEGSQALQYRVRKLALEAGRVRDDGHLDEYEDIFSGKDIRDIAAAQGMTDLDFTIGFSIDGARLYQNKKSDTWLAVWIIYDYHPSLRYKRRHILPALIIPGPNHPKNLDSFMYRAFYHLSALQREANGQGILVWDHDKGTIGRSRIFFVLGTADAVGLTALDGRVGHHGSKGCRVGCPFQGRHKPSSGHYCSAHLRPNEQSPGSDHPDYDFSTAVDYYLDPITGEDATVRQYTADLNKVMSSSTQAEYERNRKDTGLSKPSILLGLLEAQLLPPPKCFTVDLMHLLYLNIADLLIPLWRGTMKCEAPDKKTDWDWKVFVGKAWQDHGAMVARATPYFPSSFHRPPRNPALKVNSGFKATEFYLYVMGLGPGAFRKLLPKKYWINFCRLVHAVRIVVQRKVTLSQVQEAHAYFVSFVKGFENLYYQRKITRLHFCRPCLHTLLHLAQEILRMGPGAYSTQFPMERTIGDLGLEIRQPATPFSNLAQIAIRRSQASSLKILYPNFLLQSEVPCLPSTATDVGHGYFILRPRSSHAYEWNGIDDTVKNVVRLAVGMEAVMMYGRLKLPNGQICRSLYSESRASRKYRQGRNSRNAKVSHSTYLGGASC